MRPQTPADAIARALGAAGLLLVLGAGSVEALRYAMPSAARAQEQPAPTVEATSEMPADAAPATTSEPTAESPAMSEATAEPTTEPTTEPTATAEPTTEPTTEPTATAEPTSEPTATATPVPATSEPTATTPPATSVPTAEQAIGSPPLQLSKSPSAQSVAPGQSFSYRIELVSAHGGAVEVRDYIDANLHVVSASLAGGSCSVGNPVVCTATMAQGQAAVIEVTVQVPQALAAGTQLVSQALVQDDQSFTASSGPVVVQIAALGSVVDQGLQQQPAASPTMIVSDEGEEPIPSATPSATPLPPSPTATDVPSAGSDTTPAAGTATPIVSDEGAEAAPVATQAATAETAPTTDVVATAPPSGTDSPVIRPPTRPAQAVVPLPNTSSTAPAAGFGVTLMGVALIVHGTRRVRRGDGELSARVEVYARLRAIVRRVARLQRLTADTAAEMDERVRDITERL